MMHITMYFSCTECSNVSEIESLLEITDNTDEKIKKRRSRTDIWTYKKTYMREGSVDDFLNDFLHEANLTKQNIAHLSRLCNCSLRISLVSKYAQMGISLAHSSIKKIEELEIPLEISVFSWGECEP